MTKVNIEQLFAECLQIGRDSGCTGPKPIQTQDRDRFDHFDRCGGPRCGPRAVFGQLELFRLSGLRAAGSHGPAHLNSRLAADWRPQ